MTPFPCPSFVSPLFCSSSRLPSQQPREVGSKTGKGSYNSLIAPQHIIHRRASHGRPEEGAPGARSRYAVPSFVPNEPHTAAPHRPVRERSAAGEP